MPTKAQIIAYKTLLGRAGMKHEEESILGGYSVKTCKDLTEQQIGELIDWLSKRAKPAETPEALRKARSKVLVLLTDMGFKTYESGWTAINTYLAQPQIAGKRMYDMDEDELNALAKKLRAIIRKKVQNEETINHLSLNN